MNSEQLHLITISSLKYILYDTSLNANVKLTDTEIAQNLFKQINMIFKGLENVIKILFLQVDDEIYHQHIDRKLSFPKDLDILILMIGTFDKAFNEDLIELLYQIITFPKYDELYTISQINFTMIDFVADDNIDVCKVQNDLNEFKKIVKYFICEALDINTDFEPHDMFEEKKERNEEEMEENEEDLRNFSKVSKSKK